MLGLASSEGLGLTRSRAQDVGALKCNDLTSHTATLWEKNTLTSAMSNARLLKLAFGKRFLRRLLLNFLVFIEVRSTGNSKELRVQGSQRTRQRMGRARIQRGDG